eukprot:4880462-Prymnesium_polylepis.1
MLHEHSIGSCRYTWVDTRYASGECSSLEERRSQVDVHTRLLTRSERPDVRGLTLDIKTALRVAFLQKPHICPSTSAS